MFFSTIQCFANCQLEVRMMLNLRIRFWSVWMVMKTFYKRYWTVVSLLNSSESLLILGTKRCWLHYDASFLNVIEQYTHFFLWPAYSTQIRPFYWKRKQAIEKESIELPTAYRYYNGVENGAMLFSMLNTWHRKNRLSNFCGSQGGLSEDRFGYPPEILYYTSTIHCVGEWRIQP